MNRREFLGSLTAAAAAKQIITGAGMAASAGKHSNVPPQIKMFNIDLNWSDDRFVPPGQWANTSPAEHVQWCADLGANVIHSYTVSCNGYAWYKGGFVPPQPGLTHDFFPEVIRLAHKKNMLVTGYFCVGANTKWGMEHPDLSYGTPSTIHIPLTGRYLDYLTRSIADALEKTGMDICAIDWIWNPGAHGTVYNPDGQPREKEWLKAEKQLFTELTGLRFPAIGLPDREDTLVYERLAIDRCWERIRETRDRTDPNCILCMWMNHADAPTVAGSKIFKEVDWFINENPNPKLLELARGRTGKNTRLIQNLCGWANHDAKAYLTDPKHRSFDLCGFAEPGANGLLAPVAEYLSKPVDAFKGEGRLAANDYNIAALSRFYRGLPMDTVIPLKA
jgi:hypothetical protein